MLKKTIVLLVLSSFSGVLSLKAEPTPKQKRESGGAPKKESSARIAPPKPLPKGWSIVDGVWMHSDGYKFVEGRVIKIGTQTHKGPPKPPTQAEMDAAKKKKGPPTPAEVAAAKAAERERNLRPTPPRQTGTNL